MPGLIRDVACFAVGTFTALPVPAPSRVDRRVAVPGLVVAPLAVLPLGLLVGLALWAGRSLGLAPLAVAAAAVAALALATRAFHLDGLCDTADALTVSYDRARALEVMRRGDAGPAGVAAVALVLLVQVAALAWVGSSPWGPMLAGVLVCVSRGAPLLLAARGVPSARPDGLAASYAGSVPLLVVGTVWALLAAVTCLVFELDGSPWWRGLVCCLVALAGVLWLLRRAVSRFGGVTGDVYGASIEASLALLLVAAG